MVVDEAHISGDDYRNSIVETLPIGQFRERYGGLPFKYILQTGPLFSAGADQDMTDRFANIKKGVVRCIPFGDIAGYADGAVVFKKRGILNRRWEPVMELNMVAVRGLGVFYIGGEPGENKGSNIARIYEDLETNPLL